MGVKYVERVISARLGLDAMNYSVSTHRRKWILSQEKIVRSPCLERCCAPWAQLVRLELNELCRAGCQTGRSK